MLIVRRVHTGLSCEVLFVVVLKTEPLMTLRLLNDKERSLTLAVLNVSKIWPGSQRQVWVDREIFEKLKREPWFGGRAARRRVELICATAKAITTYQVCFGAGSTQDEARCNRVDWYTPRPK